MVREKLVSLEIPFVQHTVSRGSPRRQLLVDKYGKFAVPYLEVSPSIDALVTLLPSGTCNFGMTLESFARCKLVTSLQPFVQSPHIPAASHTDSLPHVI